MSLILVFTSMKLRLWVHRTGQRFPRDVSPRQNEVLGDWNTTSLTNGDYFLRLVITDNVGVSLEPCVIAVRVANQ